MLAHGYALHRDAHGRNVRDQLFRPTDRVRSGRATRRSSGFPLRSIVDHRNHRRHHDRREPEVVSGRGTAGTLPACRRVSGAISRSCTRRRSSTSESSRARRSRIVASCAAIVRSRSSRTHCNVRIASLSSLSSSLMSGGAASAISRMTSLIIARHSEYPGRMSGADVRGRTQAHFCELSLSACEPLSGGQGRGQSRHCRPGAANSDDAPGVRLTGLISP